MAKLNRKPVTATDPIPRRGQVPTREPSPSYQPRALRGIRGAAGELDHAILSHPKVASAVRDIKTGVQQLAGRLELTDTDDCEAWFVALCQHLLDTISNEADGSGLADILRQLTDALWYGVATWEAVWRESDGTIPVRLVLVYVPASTVDERLRDRHGRLTEIKQSTDAGSATLAASTLVDVVPEPEWGSEGMSVLRPIVFLVSLWERVMLAMARRSDGEAGSLVATAPQSALAEEYAQIGDTLDAIAHGDAAVGVMPHGWTVEELQMQPAGDLVARLTYVDSLIDDALNRAIRSLGAASHGSRALGEALAEDAAWSHADMVGSLIGLFGRRLFAHIATAYDYTGALPTLAVAGEDQVAPGDWSASVLAAAPVIGLHEADVDLVREDLGLPPASEAGRLISGSGAEPAGLVPREAMPQRLRGQGVDGEMPSPCSCGASPASATLTAGDYPRRPDVYEACLDWAELSDGRARDSAVLLAQAQLFQLQIRNETLALLASGPLTVADRTQLIQHWTPRVEELITQYQQARMEAAARQVPRYASAYQSSGLVSSAPARVSAVDEAASSWADAAAQMLDAAAGAHAYQIVSRTVSEAEDQVTARIAQGRRQAVTAAERAGSRVTPAGLAEQVLSDGHQAEQVGRTAGASAWAARNNLVLVSVRRSSFEDRNRCDHCLSMTGREYPVSSSTPPPPLPDPDCAGGRLRCRCGYLPLFARRAES